MTINKISNAQLGIKLTIKVWASRNQDEEEVIINLKLWKNCKINAGQLILIE